MSSQSKPPRPPGSVGGLIARRPVVRDVEVNDAGPLPDRPENAPKRLINPALLNDELNDDPSPPPAPRPRKTRTAQPEPEPTPDPTPVAPAMPLPTSGASEGRRRTRTKTSPNPEAPPAAEPPAPQTTQAAAESRSQASPAASEPNPSARADKPNIPAGPAPSAAAPAASEPDEFDGIFDMPDPQPHEVSRPAYADTPARNNDDLEDIFAPPEPAPAPTHAPDDNPDDEAAATPADGPWHDDSLSLADEEDDEDIPAAVWDTPSAPSGTDDDNPEHDDTPDGDAAPANLMDYLRRLDDDEDDDTEASYNPPALYGAPDVDAPSLAPPHIGADPSDNDADAEAAPKRPSRRRGKRGATRARAAAVPENDADLTAEGINDLLAGAAPGDIDAPHAAEHNDDENDHTDDDLHGDTDDAAHNQGGRLHVSASRGVFSSHSALSLISPNLTPHEDELNDALSAFSALDPNTKGFIRVDFRAYPAFKSVSGAYVQALRTGQDPEPQKSPGRMVFATINWVVRTILHYGTGAADKGAPAPAVPWKRPPAQLISSSQMTDDTRQAIRDAENKAKSPNHYETLLSVGTYGPESEKDQLEHIRVGVEAGFDVYATSHQRLVWRERPGYDALIGFMPPEHEKHLVLSAEELAELARVPDTLTRPQGVIIHRARIKPLPPTNPIIIDDPLSPDGGKIPLGVIHKGTDDEKVVGMRNSELDQHMFVTGRTGSGKSLQCSTIVPTPQGWTTMGELEEGDRVFDENGEICTVTHAWPVRHNRPCYEIVFNDGSSIVADGEHQWLTKTWYARKSESEAKRREAAPSEPRPWAPALENMVINDEPVSFAEMRKLGIPAKVLTGLQTRGLIAPSGTTTADFKYRDSFRTRTVPAYDRRELYDALHSVAYRSNYYDQTHKRVVAEVVTTDEIRATLNDTYDNRPNHSIDLAGAAKYPERELPIGPYTMGNFLGDGCSRNPVFASMDPPVREFIEAEGHITTDRSPSGGGCPQFYVKGITGHLRALNLNTTGSKHIPDIYKTASVEQRLALLQGLMDTDGSADKTGNLEFYSSQKRLADDVLELVSSLGFLGRIRTKEARCNGKDYGPTYTVSFSTPADVPVFRLERKLERQRLRSGQRITNRLIVDVRSVPSVPVRCIAVDSPNHLFLVGRSYIPTHNSVAMQWLVHGAIKADYPVVVVDPHGALCDDIVRNIIQFAPERVDDVVLIDFGEEEWPVALNPLDINSPDQIEPTVESVKEMLAHQMNLGGDSAPRAVAFATQALAVLTEANLYLDDPETKTTLLQVPRFFQDTEFRQLLMNFCSNPSVRETFDPEYGAFEIASDKQRSELSMPILRAFQPLGNSRSFANVFSAGHNRLAFERLVMDKKIIMLKLSHFGGQGGLASFVGSLVIPYLLQSMNSWGRVKDPETGIFHGRGLRLFIDEAATVCGPNSAAVTVLAQARKWDLGLVAAVQFPRQLDRSVEEEFYSNTASKVSLALDPQGVGGMARSLAGDGNTITPNDIVGLPNYAAYQNVLLAGADGSKYTSGAFAVHTLPPMDSLDETKKFGDEEKKVLAYIRERSRELICNPRDAVEQKRLRHVEDIRSALTQVLSDRAGEIPGLGGDEDDEPTNLNLDGSPDQDDAWLSTFEDP